MFGLRCDDCGEVRWSMIGRFEDMDRTCPGCGAQMHEERRHPGRNSKDRHDGAERRERPAFAPAAKAG